MVASCGDGAPAWRSEDISRDALRIPFGEDGYLLYGGETGHYRCGGAASFTDAGRRRCGCGDDRGFREPPVIGREGLG